MPVILLDTLISAPPEICYKLSLNVDLHRVSAGQTDEHVVGGIMHGMMELGDSVTWRARHFGIWQTLTTRITATNPYHSFTDEMTQGAFKSMQHEHHFDPTKTGTLMRDIFRFESPYGLVGIVFNFLVLKHYMRQFLTKRNEILKQVAESGRYADFLLQKKNPV